MNDPKSELVRYQKTKSLKPKEEQIITITFDIKEFVKDQKKKKYIS